MNFKRLLLIRTLTVCAVPALTLAYFALNPAAPAGTRFLINGIVLACEAVFLFKFVLFACIGHHLRGEHREKRQTAWLFVPIACLAAYTVYYFAAQTQAA